MYLWEVSQIRWQFTQLSITEIVKVFRFLWNTDIIYRKNKSVIFFKEKVSQNKWYLLYRMLMKIGCKYKVTSLRLDYNWRSSPLLEAPNVFLLNHTSWSRFWKWIYLMWSHIYSLVFILRWSHISSFVFILIRFFLACVVQLKDILLYSLGRLGLGWLSNWRQTHKPPSEVVLHHIVVHRCKQECMLWLTSNDLLLTRIKIQKISTIINTKLFHWRFQK